jgi:Ca2+-binding EF-hand superfamily protein
LECEEAAIWELKSTEHMTMRKLLVPAFVTLFASSALAQDAMIVFNALDANDDGQVTQQEASANQFVSQGFAAADSNGDGSLTAEEFTAAFGGAG